ncbi:polysaccharide lyase family 3 protein [Exserohilum turcica Et28A]|uniref:Pectate lyase n=1 Tax=Exserohilum turcicum (strain 28A) TaxID=671987 RepID=R0J467_EXST2|nr:polysaccharide lyase family 3 protein [Exserohilum turcica Et28A]EOA91536.1 polysaccharide lyase family 3 protein [Exserohilum turcica Et28A]
MISQVALLLSLVANMAAAHTLDIPTRSGDIIALPKPSVITGYEDFGNKEFDRGHPCNSDDDTGSENAVFILQDGASISNVIIGADSLEGVHCLGSCNLTNVWFRDVCEDAISILGPGDSLIVGGGAQNAIDKVVQHNGPGSVTIRNYTVVNAGKLYRSCGDCTNNSKKSPRKVIVENVRAFGLTSDLIGINSNFGDTATISGSCGSTKMVCGEYKGVDKGNGKSERISTQDQCNGEQGKLQKLPDTQAAATTLVTKAYAEPTPVKSAPAEPTRVESTPTEYDM